MHNRQVQGLANLFRPNFLSYSSHFFMFPRFKTSAEFKIFRAVADIYQDAIVASHFHEMVQNPKNHYRCKCGQKWSQSATGDSATGVTFINRCAIGIDQQRSAAAGTTTSTAFSGRPGPSSSHYREAETQHRQSRRLWRAQVRQAIPGILKVQPAKTRARRGIGPLSNRAIAAPCLSQML